MKNSEMLIKEGHALLKLSKIAEKCFIAFIILFLPTALCCGKYLPGYLALSGAYPIVNLLMCACYALLLICSFWLPLYFFGMIFIGLGQIAENTNPKEDLVFEPITKPVVPTAAPKKNPEISPAMLNSLYTALKEPFDTEMIKRLEETKQRLTKPSEKQLIQQVLDAPNGQVRTVAQRLYNKFTEKKDS